MKKVSLIALMLCLVAGIVNAEIITVQAIAEITQFDDYGGYFDDSISIGTALTITYSYDTGVIDSDSRDSIGDYTQTHPNHIDITVGNYTFSNNGDFVILISNEQTDNFQIGASLTETSLPNSGVNMSLDASNSTVLSNDSLEGINYNFDDWDNGGRISIDGDRDFRIRADINSIEIIPEPTTILLLGLGGLLFNRNKKGKGVS